MVILGPVQGNKNCVWNNARPWTWNLLRLLGAGAPMNLILVPYYYGLDHIVPVAKTNSTPLKK